MRQIFSGIAILGLVVLAFAGPALSADGFEPIAGRTEVKQIEGQQVMLPIMPELRIITEGGVNTVDLRVRIGLGDLQAKAPAILEAAVARKSNSTVELSLPRIDPPVVEAGALKIRGALKASNDDLFIEITETADFVLALTPRHDATSVAVIGTLEHFDLGNSILDGVGGGEQLLEGLAGNAIQRGLNDDDALFRIPDAIGDFGFTLTEVVLADIGNGVGELSATATAQLDGAALTRLLSTVATSFAKP